MFLELSSRYWYSILKNLACFGILHQNWPKLSYFLLLWWNFYWFVCLFFTLQYCIGFAIHQHESTTGVHNFPLLKRPSPLPPHTIPRDHPHAPTPSILYPVSNLDWWFNSYMMLYMFQCHSPKSSHPLPLPKSQKFCSVHLRLFCCLTYTVTFESVLMTWMKLEPIIQSKVSQKEKHQYSILTHIYGI